MAKEKNRVSINSLERYCDATAPDVIEKTIMAGDSEVKYEITPRLSLEDCMRFVEDVVSESVKTDELMIVPIARDFILKRNILTYYANFTMPENVKSAFALVVGADKIVGAILENIDLEQYGMIRRAIDERIAFEERKMIALQEMKVNDAIAQVNQFASRMSGLFDGVDGEQMARFVSELSRTEQITAQDLAAAVANAAQNRA